MDEFLEDEGKLGHRFTSADALEEVDIGDGDRPRPTFISAKLDPEYKQELVKLLKEYKDCFAWEYYEMPGLDRSIVEHRLPIKPGYRPHQQGSRRCNPKILPDIKAEICDSGRCISPVTIVIYYRTCKCYACITADRTSVQRRDYSFTGSCTCIANCPLCIGKISAW